MLARWLLAWLLWLGLLLAGSGAAALAPSQTALLDRALSVHSSEPLFPEQAVVRAVILPDAWGRNRQPGPVWYRMSFHALSTSAPLAVYLEQVCTDFKLVFNGEVLRVPRDIQRKLDDMPSLPCLEPALVQLPPSLVRLGDNQIDVQVFGLPMQRLASPTRIGALGQVRVGPAHLLQDEQYWAHRFAVEVTVAATAAIALIGLAALALSRVSRLAYLGYFGVAALGWALWVTLRLAGDLPLPAHWTEVLLTAALPPVAVCATLFLLRYCGVHMPWVDTSLWMQCLVVPLSLLVAMPDRLHIVAHVWPLILLAEIAVALAVFLQRAWLYSRADFWLMVGSLLTGFVALSAELALHDGQVELPGKQALGASLVVLFGGMSLRLLKRYHGEVVQAQQACAHLERRLHEAANAPPALDEHAAQAAEERAEKRAEQAAAQERKRIAADLHDDLGAKLLTIVHTSDNDRISTLAREALEEMRLSVRGLAGKPVQVGDAVGDWRSEAMNRLSQGGIELVWTVADEVLFSERRMSARAYVQTTRILREAVSNLLKHSGATHTEISIKVDANDFELLIVDNGKGIPMELDGKLDRGHGMSTMKSRAKQLQGQCLVESGPGFGTTIRLTLPL